MSNETNVWVPSQTEEGLHLIGRAVATALPGYVPGQLLTRLQGNQELLAKEAKVFLEAFLARFKSPFKYDKTQDGWELVRPEGEDWRQWPADPTAYGPAVPSEWDLTRIPELFEEVSFLHEGETYVNGLVMRQRALDEYGCPDGQSLAEGLLEHQQYIPESWRGHYLVFPGTVWRGRGGRLLVAYLCWGVERWYLDFLWLDDAYWNADGRLLRRRDSSV